MENQFNHPESEKHISTTVGIVIVVLVAVIAVLALWKYKGDIDSEVDLPVATVPIKIKKTTETPVAETNSATNNQAAVAEAPIDFDQELKDLDADAGAVDSTDFGDSGLSDANLGI